MKSAHCPDLCHLQYTITNCGYNFSAAFLCPLVLRQTTKVDPVVPRVTAVLTFAIGRRYLYRLLHYSRCVPGWVA